MATLTACLDGALGLSLIGLAVLVTTSRSIWRAIILFMVFGLLAALAWTRLHAGDIALAEAAIGAGVTGALLLNTAGRLRTIARWREASTTGAVPASSPDSVAQ